MGNRTVHLEEQAQYYRAALLLGLHSGAEVVEWAVAVLADENAVPHTISEIITANPDDVTGLRYLLLELCAERLPLQVQRKILRTIHRDFKSGRRPCGDTITVLSQFRRFEKILPELGREILTFEMKYSLVDHGTGSEGSLEQELAAWFDAHDQQ